MMVITRIGLLAALVALVSQAAPAQPMNTVWFVQAGGGMGAHDNGPFSNRLQSYTPRQADGEHAVYRTEDFSNVGYTVGGSAGYMLDGGLLVGLSGEKLMFPMVEAITSPGRERDTYTLGGWGAGLDVGYTIVNSDATIVYPFIHAGYYGYSLDYSNRQSEPIPFFEGEPVAPGETATFTAAGPRAAIGIGMNSFVGGAGQGGFMIGARLAYGRMLSESRWEFNGDTVNNGGHAPCYNAMSLTLTIGFGGGR